MMRILMRGLAHFILVAIVALLTACGGGGSSDTSDFTGEEGPIASAGPDQNVTTGSLVTLDGSKSTDPGGKPLNYFWIVLTTPEGSQASLSDSTAVKPTFIADLDGKYTFALVVTNGVDESMESHVTVTAATGNSAPVANAGTDQNVAIGSTVTLDGSVSSDADADTLTFSWNFTSKPEGSSAVLSSNTDVKPTFVADLDGDYVLRLVVNDGTVDSRAVTVTISAVTENSAPVADASVNQNVATGSTVTLDGSASSDADGDTLTFSWGFTSRPESSSAVLSSTTAVKPTFVADVDGDYVLWLLVNDGATISQADTVTINASTANSAPVADAGVDQNVATGSTVIMDGSASSDADNDTLTFSWSFTARPDGSSAALSSTTAVQPTFLADVDGDYVLRLVVNDGTVDSQENMVTISAAVSNYPVLSGVVDFPYNLSKVTEKMDNGESQSVEFMYDSKNRLVEKNESYSNPDGSNHSFKATFKYDIDDRLIEVIEGNYSTYFYYSGDTLVNIKNKFVDISITYDDHERVSTIIESGADNEEKELLYYNNNGLIGKIEEYEKSNGAYPETPKYSIVFFYNISGRINSIEIYNSSDVLDTRTIYSYDSNGRMIKRETFDVRVGSKIDSESFSYDVLGNILSVRSDKTYDSSSTTTFSFNNGGMPDAGFGKLQPPYLMLVPLEDAIQNGWSAANW